MSDHQAMQDDLAALLRALGLGDHARSRSPHDVMVQEVIPEVERLRARVREVEEADRKTRDEFIEAWKAKERAEATRVIGVRLAGLAVALASDVELAFRSSGEDAMRAFGNNGPGHLAREVASVARQLCDASDRAAKDGTATWLPIETAPKDGTLVLACRAGFEVDDGGFSAGIQPCSAYFGTYHPNAAGKAEWRNARTRAKEPALTHWMPLPAPPDRDGDVEPEGSDD